MDEVLKQKLDSYIENFEALRLKYRRKTECTNIMYAACLHSLEDRKPDFEKIDCVFRYIRKNSGFFSCFRSTLRFPTSVLLSVKFPDKAVEAFDSLTQYYKKLTDAGFKKSPYLGMAAQALLLGCPEDFLEEHISKAVHIYRKMKNNHFWLTSQEDYPVAVMLASSDEDAALVTERVENIFEALVRKGFRKNNGLQFLSHILALSQEEVEPVTDKCRTIYEELKKNGMKIKPFYYASLGILTLIDLDSKNVANDIVEASAYMKDNRAFKWGSRDIGVLLLCAMLNSVYIDEKTNMRNIAAASMNVSVYALIAAQTAAMVAAVMAASAAASASH